MESARLMYTVLSGCDTASTIAFGAGCPAGQSKTTPEIDWLAISGPVENTSWYPNFSALPRRSEIPGSMITVYVVFGFQSLCPRTEIRVRCHPTRGAPSRGEMSTSASSELAPDGRSVSTSSYWKFTSFSETLRAFESGVVLRSLGGILSGGP